MGTLWDIVALLGTVGFWTATFRIATTYLLAGLGELICERAGILNLGITGIMLMGAMTGFSAVYLGASLWLAIALSSFAGALFGLIHGLFSVVLGVNQYVAGIGITLLGGGLSLFLYRKVTAGTDFSNPPRVEPFQPLEIPLLHEIPGVGPALFAQRPLVYIGFLLAPVIAYALFRTPAGLVLRTVGENPVAAEAAGYDVYRTRLVALSLGSGLMGVAGAYLSISYFSGFLPEIVAGRGWIAIALVIFANWSPLRVAIAAVMFGGIEAMAVRVDALAIEAPYEIFLMLPYVLTILIMIVVARRASYPAALTIPFRRGERV